MVISAHLSTFLLDFTLEILFEDENYKSDESCESSEITTMEGLPLILKVDYL